MKRWMRSISVLAPSAFALGVISGCAEHNARPPTELQAARQEYKTAQSGPAAQNNQAGLIEARSALGEAEEKYQEKSDETSDYGYVAKRKAQIAESEARTSEAVMNDAEEQKAEVARQKGMLEKEQASLGRSERRAKMALDKLGLSAKEEARGTVITVPSAMMFATDKADILPGAKKKLTDIANAVKEISAERSPQDKGRMIMLNGYTDDTGSDQHNMDLSKRRAEAVRTFFTKQGIDDSMIETEGKGESDPVGDNKTKEGRAENRRVEIVITPPAGGGAGGTMK